MIKVFYIINQRITFNRSFFSQFFVLQSIDLTTVKFSKGKKEKVPFVVVRGQPGPGHFDGPEVLEGHVQCDWRVQAQTVGRCTRLV